MGDMGASKVLAQGNIVVAELPGGVLKPLSQTWPISDLEEGDERPQEDASSDEVVVMPHAFEMRRDARAFGHRIKSLREAKGFSKLIYAPGMMEVSNMALLAYMGVDLFDSALLSYQSARGLLCRPEGTLPAKDAPWLLHDISEASILECNLKAAWDELCLIRHMISVGRLRELAETRVNSTPWGVASLRLFDLECYDFQEAQTPVVGPRFYANSRQSLHRPDIERWRRRVLELWSPAPHKKVLLLIPCSAKKPYFTSKSHQVLRESLMSVPNAEVVQELIITSPLGAVPRELELFYPAAQYDIPVTGNWDLEEQRMIREQVSSAASKGFEKVVCHLGHGSDFVKESVDCLDTSEGSATSRESLHRLEEALTSLCKSFERPPRGAERTEALASAAKFQFGRGGEALTSGCSVMGNYPYSKILDGRVQMGMLTPERGMISLTLDGASRLMPLKRYWVETQDFDLTGNLFAVGVKDADPGIRIGDEALILRNGQLEGVGIAAMSGREMTQLRKGEAVRTRHKRRSSST